MKQQQFGKSPKYKISWSFNQQPGLPLSKKIIRRLDLSIDFVRTGKLGMARYLSH